MLVCSRAVYDGIVEHARAGAPAEVCGILGGTVDDEECRVTTQFRTENVADETQTEYAIDPAEQLAVFETIEQRGRNIAGFYHSHPQGPPEPSQTDRATATWDGYRYVIVALDGTEPFVGAWRWTGESFEAERVTIR
ncbi:MAG: desampylase [Halorientalis sp.]